MGLLSTSTLELVEFMGEIPPYAILSHTWEDGEVSYQDMQANQALPKAGYEKIRQCCRIAASDGFQYAWVDTCCIDKLSSSELSEAINSMYRWYAEAGVCYVYLPDVDLKLHSAAAVARLRRSRWFTRGWTLQELIAPASILFFDCHWKWFGTKSSFESVITDITGINPHVLAGRDGALYNTSVAQKMSWASKRTTTRVEDVAYSLMGLFGVHMPMLYGEGDNAFKRLQEEILRSTDDHTIFAWRESEGNPAQLSLRSGVLTNSPAKFAHSGKFIVKAHSSTRSTQPASISSMGIRLQLPISDLKSAKCNIVDLEKQSNVRLAYLNCFDSVTDQQVGTFVEAAPISDSDPSSFTVQRAVPFFLQVGSFLAFPGDRYLNQKNTRRSEVQVPKELSDCHAVLWGQSLLSQHNSDKHPFRSKYLFQLSKSSQDSGYRILDLWPRERCFDSYRTLDEAFKQTFTLPSGRNAIVGGAWIAFPKSVGGSFVVVTKTVHGNLTSNIVVPTDARESLEQVCMSYIPIEFQRIRHHTQVARTWNDSSDHMVAEIPGNRASISVKCRRQLFQEFAFYLVDIDV